MSLVKLRASGTEHATSRVPTPQGRFFRRQSAQSHGFDPVLARYGCCTFARTCPLAWFPESRRELMPSQEVSETHGRDVFRNRCAERESSKQTHQGDLVQRFFPSPERSAKSRSATSESAASIPMSKAYDLRPLDNAARPTPPVRSAARSSPSQQANAHDAFACSKSEKLSCLMDKAYCGS